MTRVSSREMEKITDQLVEEVWENRWRKMPAAVGFGGGQIVGMS